MALVLKTPNYYPSVCYVCGVGADASRRWFVDLQLPIDHYLNPVNDGAIYLCNECWEGMAKEVAKQAQTLLFGEENWAPGEYVEPTYNNETELEVIHVGRQYVPDDRIRELDVINSVNVGIEPLNEGDDQEPERDDPDTNGSIEEGDAEPTSDGVANPVRELGDFFAK